MHKLSVVFALAAVAAGVFSGSASADPTDKQAEMGTVIGIDLGTTYSW